ncbi:MAG TPA: aminotransferase class III-fold pyridoxal phosphate-dependent enzyme, partial [Polyangiales bacterium]
MVGGLRCRALAQTCAIQAGVRLRVKFVFINEPRADCVEGVGEMLELSEKPKPARTPEGWLPRADGEPLRLERSNALLAEAQKLVPGVTQSWMKRPEMFALGSYPVFVSRGEGAVVTDVDGQSYVDFICGLGANTLGHNHPLVLSTLQ